MEQQPLTGIKVVELAMWMAGPACTAVLGDWGADVIKLEDPRSGDPSRAFTTRAVGSSKATVRPPFELVNRNKRSVAVDLRKAEGRRFADKLLERADVFVTNLRIDALERMELTYERLSRLNPRLIYATLNGYGHRGPERNRPAFDYAAAWARAGLMWEVGEPGAPPPAQRPAMIDNPTGLALAGAISAALFARERTGRGQEVRISLFAMGLWMNAADITGALLTGRAPQQESRRERPNPLWNSYQCGDGRWVYFVMIQSDRHWPQFCAALGKPEWLTDPKYADSEARSRHNRELIKAIDEVLASKPRDKWAQIFDAHGLFWAPVQTCEEVLDDPQAQALGIYRSVPHPEIPDYRLVASPVEFGSSQVGPRSVAPALGQHTESVALELGFPWEEIAKLKELGALG